MIYFIQQGHDGPMKIGYTKNHRTVKTRLSALQIGSSYKLRLRGLFHGTPKDEHYLHNKFKHLRIRGEWFKSNKTLLGYITETYYKYIACEYVPREYGPSRYLPGNIKDALSKSGGNKTKAARLLNISRATLYRKLSELADTKRQSIFT